MRFKVTWIYNEDEIRKAIKKLQFTDVAVSQLYTVAGGNGHFEIEEL